MPRKKKEKPARPAVEEQADIYGKDESLSKLDTNQAAAVTHGEGPMLVVAGAGTGKTRVITNRIAWLINEKKCEPSQILALTFSDKAAKEMERRVDAMVPYGMVDTHISTFHSFGYDIINENFAEMRISPDWKMLQKADSVIFVVENLEKFGLEIYKPLNNPTQYISKFVDLVSKLKDSLITPQEYEQFAKEQSKAADDEEKKEIAASHLELARFYAEYEKIKTEKNFMDYGDLICRPYFLLRDKKHVLAKYREKFKYILIDEFQDTNYAQFELVKLIADKNRNLSVVGDDDQMIYKFRGAAISNIMGFKEHYKDAKVVVLKNNYRSSQVILDAAYKLIQNNGERLETKLNIEKRLISQYKPEHKIDHLGIKSFDNYSAEADSVADTIDELVNKKKLYTYKDIAILVRSKNDAKMFLKTLERRGMPYKFTGDEGLYNKKEVQFLINFCKTLVTPYEFNPLIDVAISEFYNINPYVMAKAGNVAKEYSMPVYEVLKKVEFYERLDVDEKEAKKIEILIRDLDHYTLRLKEGWGAGEILYDYLKNRKIFESLLREKTIEAEKKVANISRFFGILKQFSVSEDYDTVFNFVNYIDLRQKAGDNPTDEVFDDIEEDSVQVATVHKAKGLEYKIVFVVAMIQDKFPVRNRGGFGLPLPEAIMKDMVAEDTYHKEEERRLFYVAMTRAQDALYLSFSSKYDGTGGKKMSMFLAEIGAQPPEATEKKLEIYDKIRYFEQHKKAVAVDAKHKETAVRLSNYQIDDYLTCPYKYKLIHVFKMPIKEEPNIVYGQAMHRVASEYYKARQEKREMSLEDLKTIFKAMWKPTGFISRDHEKKRFERGLLVIEQFYNTEEKKPGVPLYIEKSFEFKLSKDIVVAGRWDRIDKEGDKTTIIDYKTSEVHDLEKAKKKINSPDISKQLTLYSLAYEKVYGTPVTEAGVYFLESAIMLTKKFKPDTIKKFEEEIFEVAGHIQKKEFDAAPSSFTCSQCVFADMCEFSKADVLF